MNIQFMKYVRLYDIDSWKAAGWEETDALKGTHHGDYSELMIWTGEGEPVYPEADAVAAIREAICG